MKPLTVTELTREIGAALEEGFGDVAVEGEVSGFKAASSGHWYFSLKDAGAVLNCAMFRGDNLRVRRAPRDGDRVIARGGVDVYPPRGSYSLVVRRLEASGAGDLQRQLEERKARLAAEGLFDLDRKRPLPRFPFHVGLATSPTGAALRDLLRVIHQRFPAANVYLSPCRVQGEGADREVAEAIDRLARHGSIEVVIVGRGGGAAEDLMAFNEESVVRAIRRCPVPVVSAVGHEVDVTLADLAADVRAATPSHAAELVVPERDALVAWIDEQEERARIAATRRLTALRDRLSRTRLVHPRERVAAARGRAVDLDRRLGLLGKRLVDGPRARLAPLPDRLRRALAAHHATRVARLAAARARLLVVGERAYLPRRARLATASARLDALSPLRVLDRGFAVVHHGGRPVLDASALEPGDALVLRFARGEADARVTATRAPRRDPGGSPPGR